MGVVHIRVYDMHSSAVSRPAVYFTSSRWGAYKLLLILIALMGILSGCSTGKEQPYNADDALALRGWKKEQLMYNPDGPEFKKDEKVYDEYQKNLKREQEKQKREQAKKASANQGSGSISEKKKQGARSASGNKVSVVNKWGVDLAQLSGAKYIRADDLDAGGGLDEASEVKNMEVSTKATGNGATEPSAANSAGGEMNNPRPKPKPKFAKLRANEEDDEDLRLSGYVGLLTEAGPDNEKRARNKKSTQEDEGTNRKSRYASYTAIRFSGEEGDDEGGGVTVDWNSLAQEPHMFNEMDIGGEHISATYDMYRSYPAALDNNSISARPKVFVLTYKK